MNRARFLLPAALLVLIYLLDILFSRIMGDQTFAPALCVLSLFGMAMVFSVQTILFWIPGFAGMAYWLIYDVSAFPITRTITVVLAGLMAAYASRQRQKVDEQLGEIDAVLSHLPTPWALLNEEGAILKTNSTGAALLGSTPEEISGNSIFDAGSSGQNERRRRIEDFLKVPQASAPHALAFKLEALGENPVTASIFRIPTRRGRLSLLVFQVP